MSRPYPLSADDLIERRAVLLLCIAQAKGADAFMEALEATKAATS